MSTKEFGVTATLVASHAYIRFVRSAEVAVANQLEQVLESVRRGYIGPGIWHPNGFATFRITFLESLGLIRLHVWPRGLRRALSGHPIVHRHSFDLYSRILVGHYLESQYRIDRVAGSESPTPRLKEYTVRPNTAEHIDVLSESDYWVTARRSPIDHHFRAGSWHDLEAGVYHATEIPESELCATIAVLGRHHSNGRDALVGKPGFQFTENTRESVADGDVKEICAQLRTGMDLRN